MRGLDFGLFGSGLLLPPTGPGVRFSLLQLEPDRTGFGFVFAEKALLVICSSCIYPEPNRIRIACV